MLVDATGRVYGLWVIEGMSETGTLFRVDSLPRRIDFSITLNRVDDNRIDQVGLITDPNEVIA